MCCMYCAGAVELMRTMMAKSKKPGHLWPMAMYSWEVMPPPAGLEKDLGERRLTGYAGTGQQCRHMQHLLLQNLLTEGVLL